VIASKLSVASAAFATVPRMGWVDRSASRCSAVAFPASKSSHTRQPGRQRSTILYAIQVAKASFSQRSSHQTMVTQLPNHWWASSWVTTSATRFCTESGAVDGSSSSASSR